MGIAMATALFKGAGPSKITELDAKNGLYEVDGRLWKVGSRYKILEFLGGGAYGQVCKAQDKATGEFVAVKMVKDAMQSESVLKNVLREVCIMRRLSHPNILSLMDVFLNSPEDKNDKTDLYIVSQFADRGSILDLQGPLCPDDVKHLMRQILEGLKYMHFCNVWHRDIKAGNVLVMSPLTVKICDFNLSRPVQEVTSDVNIQRCYSISVMTPTYHPPELIMSPGNYGSAIDIWGAGCIFWKLLKLSSPGKLQIKHIFHQKHTMDKYLQAQEKLPDSELERLQTICDIFSIIGTPCWNDIDTCVPNPKWRNYLKNLTGKVGSLENTLGEVDYEALDLLSRMLQFNPDRRCTAEEALSHHYFSKPALQQLLVRPGYPAAYLSKISTLQQIEESIQSSMNRENSMQILMDLLTKEVADHHSEKRSFNPRKRPLECWDSRDEENIRRLQKHRKKSLLDHIHDVFL